MKNLLALILIACLAQISQAQTLIADFPFHGNANDESTNINDGTVFGAILGEDRFGNANSAYYFDGVDDYIDFGNNGSLDLTDGYSVSGWFNTSASNSFQMIVSNGLSAGGFSIYLYNNGVENLLYFYLDGVFYSSAVPISAGWNHFALTAQTGTNGVKLYLNGDIEFETTASTSLVGGSAYNLEVGRDAQLVTYNFVGLIDDIKINSEVLSASFIEDLSDPNPLFLEVISATSDEVLYKNPGIVSGAILAEDRFENPNSAYQFDGVDDYIDFGNNPSLDLRDGFSISAWFKLDSATTFQTIMGRGYAGDGDYWLAAYNDGTNMVFRFWLEGFATNGTIPIPEGWNHVVLNVASGDNNIKLYLNGDLYLETTASSDLIGSSSNNLRVGNDDRDESYFFGGLISEFKIYDGVLSEGKIRQENTTSVDPVLVLDLPFNGNADDESGFDNHGTLFNSPMLTEDRFGNSNSAYLFDAVDDYIDFGDDTSLDLKSDWTLAGWFRSSSNLETFQIIASRGFSVDGSYIAYIFNDDTRTVLNFYLDGVYYPSFVPVSDSWNHFAITAATGTDSVKLYLNGDLKYQTTATTDLEGSSIYPLQVGADYNELGGLHFDGELDDIKIFDQALTAEEISDLIWADDYFPVDDLAVDPDFGNALDFGTSTESWVNLPPDGWQDLTSFSFETWIDYNGSNVTTDGDILYAGSAAGECCQYFSIGVNKAKIYALNNFGHYEIDYSPTYNSGWNHFAFTLNESDSTYAFYVNGHPVETTNATVLGTHPNPNTDKAPFFPAYYPASVNAFFIGRDETTSNYFKGTLDETRVWNYALSEEEINSRMNIPLNGNEEGLVYYFDYNQGIPGGSNPNVTTLEDRANEFNGVMAGFSLEGNQSNWIEFVNANQNTPKIFTLDKKSGVAGEVLRIYGQNFVPKDGYTNVFIGDAEAEILDFTTNTIDVIIPEGLDVFSQLKVFTSLGVSEPFDFTLISNNNKKFVFQERKLRTDYLLGSDIYPADMNGDGFIDIVTTSRSSSEGILIFYNTSEYELLSGSYDEVPFLVPGTTSVESKNLQLIDLNGDGKLDIVSRTNAGVRWYDNSKGFSAAPIIGNGSYYAPGDIDVDGDIDISIIINSDSIVWYRNDGFGNFSTPSNSLVFSDLTNSPTVGEAMLISDIDGDSDQDFILGSNYTFGDGATRINARILINDGGGNFSPIEIGQDINTQGGFYTPPIVMDYDNDGDFDILFGSEYSAYIYLFENDGDLGFNHSQILRERASRMSPGDFNGDGRVDFAFTLNAPASDDTFWWAENTSEGTPNFTVNQIASDFFGQAEPTVRSADLDNDGDLDLMTISEFDGQVIVYENIFTDNDFTDFSLVQEVEGAIIDTESATITIVVENGTSLSELIPQFTLSDKASVTISGEPQISGETMVSVNSFRSIIYQVTSESGAVKQWIVQVEPLPGLPQITGITNISQTGAIVSWTNTTYTSSYDVLVSTDNFTSYATFTSETNSVELTLESGTEYDIKILSVNDFGVAADFSPIVSFSTIPSTPLIESTSDITTNSAIVLWNEILGASQYRLDVGLDEAFTNYFTGYNSRIISNTEENILGLKPGTEYWLRLRAQNESGLSPTSEIASFITLPNIPNFTFKGVTQSEFGVDWNMITGADSYELEILDVQTIEVTSDNTDYAFSELEAGSTFSVRLRSQNASGYSSWSDYKDVTLIPPNPAVVGIGEITDVSAVAFWQGSNGAAGYIIEVARDEAFTDLVGGYGPRGVTALSESIVGLAAGTTYYFRVRAANSSGISGNSDVVPFLTRPKTPVFVLSSISFDEVTFTWTKDKGEEGFEILQVVNNESTTTTYGSESTQAVFTDLLPSTQYQYSIRSVNASGSSDYSVPISITTVPAQVEELALDEIGQTSSVLSWSNVTGASSYLLEISDNGFSTNISGYNPKTIAGTSEIVENLKAGTKYEARIRSSNASGPSQYSEVFEFITIPNNPVARDASNITTTSFNANWDGVDGLVDGYMIQVAKNEGFTEIVDEINETGLNTSISGLEEGVSHWYRIVAFNASGQSGYSNVVSVNQALLIEDLSFNSEPVKETVPEIPVTFLVTGGTNDHDVTFRYRRVLSENWTEVTLTSTSGEYSFTILPSFLDDVGLEFEIVVNDGESIKRNSENFIYWNDPEPQINTISLSNKWQLFSIPYELDDTQVGAIFDELLALKYKSQWRLMHYNGQNYLDANGGGISEIELGKGYWFYTTEKVTVDIGSGSVHTESPFTITLREGWNQIGNPYNVNINWVSVLNNNQLTGIVEEVLLYNAGANSFFVSDDLNPFGGAFVWSNAEVEIEISLKDDISSGRIAKPAKPSSDIDQDIWQLDLSLFDGNHSYSLASIGMHPDAIESKDIYDRVTHPRFFDYVELYTVQDDYFFPYFRKDIRASNDEEVWNFTVSSNFLNGGTLSWDNSQLANRTYQLWLVDEKNGQVLNMNDTDSYSADFSDNHRLSIHLTKGITPPLPLSLHINDPYPNPTGGVANVQLILPESQSEYSLDLKIVDMSGREVLTVASGSYKPGRYDFASDLKGHNLKSGVYFYRLKINSKESSIITKKIVLKK